MQRHVGGKRIQTNEPQRFLGNGNPRAMPHQFMRHDPADVGENKIQLRMLQHTAVPDLQDIGQVGRVPFADPGHIRIQPGFERTVTETAHRLTNHFTVTGGIGGPAGRTGVLQKCAQALLHDSGFANKKDFGFNRFHTPSLLKTMIPAFFCPDQRKTTRVSITTAFGSHFVNLHHGLDYAL
ncbi:MAG: hypothetical protein BWX80_03895 [Candidatus Hydrogenedentes bacterium ADurb.Bin101]|nr:MAG: hypothetical protein BWX80_03895 [Candidatus Hydrogenedentes bacterium ADurb.Bin101]